MLKRYLLLSLCLFSFPYEVLFAHPSESDRDRGGSTNLACRFGRVERAGVALVKDYGVNQQHPSLRFAVIVGVEERRNFTQLNGQAIDYVNFFGGSCEKNDQYSTVTAAEELWEETGKAIEIPSRSFQAGNDGNYYGYAYSGDNAPTNTRGKSYNQLFFYRKDDASITAINRAMRNAHGNHQLSHRFKENKSACAIPLQEILDRARAIHTMETTGNFNQAQAEANYIFKTRGKGDGTGRKPVYLDPQYMRNLARDITRNSQNLSVICNRISGGNVN